MVLAWLKETYDVTTYRNLVRNIFLNLNPRSLKMARQVCKKGDWLVMKEVWGSEEGRREMERRLDRQWREAQPTRREVVVRLGYEVLRATCDETHIAVTACRMVDWRFEDRLFLYSAMDLSLICDQEIDNIHHLEIGTSVLAGIGWGHNYEREFLSVWRKADGTLLYRQSMVHYSLRRGDRCLRVLGNKVGMTGHIMSSDQERVFIHQYKEGGITHAAVMMVANPLLKTAMRQRILVDVDDPRILLTVYETDDRQWLCNVCINLWDMEEEKHVKTVMVATGGRVGPVLLKSHQLLVEMGGAWNYGAIQPPRTLVVINLNTGEIVKAVGV